MTIQKLEEIRHKLYKKRNNIMEQVGTPSYRTLIKNIREVELKIEELRNERD